MQVQEESLSRTRIRGAVQRQLGGGGIRENSGDARLGTAEPHLRGEGAVGNPVGLTDVLPLVLGDGLNAVANLRGVFGRQPQILQGYAHDECVCVHHVCIGIAPGAVERIVGELLQRPVFVAHQAHDREVQPCGTVGFEHIIGAVIAVRIDIDREGVFLRDHIPVPPRADAEGKRAFVRVFTRLLERGRVRGRTHMLQVRLHIAADPQVARVNTIHRCAPLEGSQQGAVSALVQLSAL